MGIGTPVGHSTNGSEGVTMATIAARCGGCSTAASHWFLAVYDPPRVATLPVDQGCALHHSMASKPSRPSSTVGHERAARVAPAAHVGDDEDVAPGGEIAAAFQALLVAGRFQVGRAREDDGEPAVGVGAIDVGRERHAVAHRDPAVELDLDLVDRLRRFGLRIVGPAGAADARRKRQAPGRRRAMNCEGFSVGTARIDRSIGRLYCALNRLFRTCGLSSGEARGFNGEPT